ncbi:hypothetical protein D3C80_1544860 [compost metagenome]
MQLAGHAEPGHQLRAGGFHPAPGRITGQFVEGTGGIGDHEHIEAFFQGRQCREGHANLGHHTGDDQLLLAGGLDCLDEVFVVPGIDVARARDVRRVRELLLEFGHQRAIWAVLEAGGEDGRQLEVLGQVRQGQHIVLETVGFDIPYQREQTRLVIHQQYGGVVLVQSLVLKGHDVFLTRVGCVWYDFAQTMAPR